MANMSWTKRGPYKRASLISPNFLPNYQTHSTKALICSWWLVEKEDLNGPLERVLESLDHSRIYWGVYLVNASVKPPSLTPPLINSPLICRGELQQIDSTVGSEHTKMCKFIVSRVAWQFSPISIPFFWMNCNHGHDKFAHQCKGWWHRKLKYSVCFLIDLFLFYVWHLSNSTFNNFISAVKSSWTSLY